MDRSPHRQSAQVNDEGELVDLKFCVYCSEINPPDATICQHCGEYIADQSPDLRSRLERISRRASATSTSDKRILPAFRDDPDLLEDEIRMPFMEKASFSLHRLLGWLRKHSPERETVIRLTLFATGTLLWATLIVMLLHR